LDYKDSRTETFLKEATVRQLRELSQFPVGFLDGSFSFATIAAQDNYGPGHLDFPADLYGWAGLPYITTSTSPLVVKQFIDGPRPLEEVRAANGVSNLSGVNPSIFAWFNGYMWLAPAPTGVQTIQGDYRRDGRRDSTSGALITTASTTHTNGWFDEGENTLRCAVLLEYHESISKDGKAIQLYRDQVGRTLVTLKKSRNALRAGLMQAGDSMFSNTGGVPNKQAWRWV